MTQIHPDPRTDTTGDNGQPSQTPPPAHPDPWSQQGVEPTTPVWFGETREIPADHAALGLPGAAGNPTLPGAAGASTPLAAGAHPAYPPLTTPPAGPPPSFPTRDGAEHAQPGKRRRLTELTAVAALAALLASGGTYAAAQLGDSPQASSPASSSSLGRGDTGPVVQADATNPNWTATAAAVAPSVVSITVKSGQSEAQGSGVIIDAKGHVLTNNHVVAGAGTGTQITVTLNDGRTYKATVAGTDPSTDLAVITLASAPSDLKAIAIGNSDDLKVGDPVMAIGNPLGLAGTVTTGIVSALNRPVTTAAEDDSQPQDQNPFGQGLPGQQQPSPGSSGDDVVTNAIQTSAAINPGNSGGALVNASGQLVGINSSIASLGSSGSSQSGSIGIGFAIPANEAKSIASQLISTGKAEHAFLGVSLGDGTASDGTSQRAGAEITQVSSGTPAADAGLQKGDVVVAVDSERVDSALALVANVRERAVGDKVTLTVLRDGKRVDLTATLVARAAATS
ncbi:putative serine protease PepD [Pedococcus dokdonensis]|uniref:Putative serine protease PepD n=1 Tax=Pedococcus dokdonensis TaxID=443156 RepID=A0A1H0SMM3_9MICO|nr:trypsin-like peptidase domain-containing protein [Pedococcus dokdonensis]SDP42983.1 putative serine protease PepD [Pedococcus dokdonensis]